MVAEAEVVLGISVTNNESVFERLIPPSSSAASRQFKFVTAGFAAVSKL